MKYKSEAPIAIAFLYGIELAIDIEQYGIDVEDGETYYEICGELFYCGLPLDGKIIVPETFLNDFIKKYSLTMKIVNNNTVYTNISESDLKKLHTERFDVRHVTTENVDPDDDFDDEEEYIFVLK